LKEYEPLTIERLDFEGVSVVPEQWEEAGDTRSRWRLDSGDRGRITTEVLVSCDSKPA
jgi:hypothetical protein